MFEIISTLFTVQEDNLPFGPRILCKKCYRRRIEKLESTVEEVANLKGYYKKNLYPKLCSSTQSPRINWNNNDLPNCVGRNAKTSVRCCKCDSQFHPFACHLPSNVLRTFVVALSRSWSFTNLSARKQTSTRHLVHHVTKRQAYYSAL